MNTHAFVATKFFNSHAVIRFFAERFVAPTVAPVLGRRLGSGDCAARGFTRESACAGFGPERAASADRGSLHRWSPRLGRRRGTATAAARRFGAPSGAASVGSPASATADSPGTPTGVGRHLAARRHKSPGDIDSIAAPIVNPGRPGRHPGLAASFPGCPGLGPFAPPASPDPGPRRLPDACNGAAKPSDSSAPRRPKYGCSQTHTGSSTLGDGPDPHRGSHTPTGAAPQPCSLRGGRTF